MVQVFHFLKIRSEILGPSFHGPRMPWLRSRYPASAIDPGCVETVDTVVGKARNKAFVEFGDFGAATPLRGAPEGIRCADEKIDLSERTVFDDRAPRRGKRTSENRPIFESGTFSTASLGRPTEVATSTDLSSFPM